MSRARNSIDSLSVDQLLKILKELNQQLNATKRMLVRYRGVVTDSMVVPDHRTQLRAAIELSKVHGLYPHTGQRHAGYRYDRSERPVLNLVMHDPER